MVPQKEPWDLSCSSLNCKMGAFLLFLLPEMLFPQFSVALATRFKPSLTPHLKQGGQSPSSGP